MRPLFRTAALALILPFAVGCGDDPDPGAAGAAGAGAKKAGSGAAVGEIEAGSEPKAKVPGQAGAQVGTAAANPKLIQEFHAPRAKEPPGPEAKPLDPIYKFSKLMENRSDPEFEATWFKAIKEEMMEVATGDVDDTYVNAYNYDESVWRMASLLKAEYGDSPNNAGEDLIAGIKRLFLEDRNLLDADDNDNPSHHHRLANAVNELINKLPGKHGTETHVGHTTLWSNILLLYPKLVSPDTQIVDDAEVNESLKKEIKEIGKLYETLLAVYLDENVKHNCRIPSSNELSYNELYRRKDEDLLSRVHVVGANKRLFVTRALEIKEKEEQFLLALKKLSKDRGFVIALRAMLKEVLGNKYTHTSFGGRY